MSVAVSGCTATPEDDHRPETQLLSRYRPASHRSPAARLSSLSLSPRRERPEGERDRGCRDPPYTSRVQVFGLAS